MPERDEDLALLRMFGGSKHLPRWKFFVSLGAWSLVVVVAIVGAYQGKYMSLLQATVGLLGALMVSIQYYLVGPLCREIKRLRYELDMLRT